MINIRSSKYQILSKPAILFSVLGLLFTVATFLTLSNDYSGIGQDIIFYGSIITTIAAIFVPLLSLKKFGLNSYRVKMISLSLGLIGVVALYIVDSFFSGTIENLKLLSSKGLLWGMNTALLLFNLTYMEIENQELKNQAAIEKLKELEEKNLEELRKRNEELIQHRQTLNELKESKEEIKQLKKKENLKKGNDE